MLKHIITVKESALMATTPSQDNLTINHDCQMLNSTINTSNIKLLLDLMRRITIGFWL
jgi:hypothetical protein